MDINDSKTVKLLSAVQVKDTACPIISFHGSVESSFINEEKLNEIKKRDKELNFRGKKVIEYLNIVTGKKDNKTTYRKLILTQRNTLILRAKNFAHREML